MCIRDRSQSISAQLISDIVNATKLEVDFSARSSLKLIRSSCLILFRDCALTELLEILLNWYIEVLSISISDSTAHNQVVVQLSECIVLLYEYHGPNLAYYFLHVFESLAKEFLKQISTIAPSARDSFLRFFHSFFAICSQAINSSVLHTDSYLSLIHI